MIAADAMTPFQADNLRTLLAGVESLIAGLPRTPPCGMPPALYASDRKRFYRERDRLRADLGLPPGAPDPYLRALMRAARAA